ncbi:MAG: endonuclease [Gammaproteobacteria bacterium]|nr:endonuclease [Gammaproteobacteria bacterium]
MRNTCFKLSAIALALPISAFADIPEGYYDSVNTSSPQALRESLHKIIDNHQWFPYTSSSTDTWDILEQADQDPLDSGKILDIYRNRSVTKQGGGNNFYNREHTWPKSYGFADNDNGIVNHAYTDTHHLFLSDSSYNSERSNKPFDNCVVSCVEYPTDLYNGIGGTEMQSNYSSGDFTFGTWEIWSPRKGDIARAIFYMAIRYEGGFHETEGLPEPDLRLTDDRNLMDQNRSNNNLPIAYMGIASVLYQWHQDDPVDDKERQRNDVVYSFQNNRNPFIDHPEYVACVFQLNCESLGGIVGDTSAPASPLNLNQTIDGVSVTLSWTQNNESDIAGYHIYRTQNGGSTFYRISNELVTGASFNENLDYQQSFQYKITSIDNSANESGYSNTVNVVIGDEPDTNPPAAPQGLSGDATDTTVTLDWNNNSESDLSGYRVYRSDDNGATYDLLNEQIIQTSNFVDDGLTPETDYRYRVSAVDGFGNESTFANLTISTTSEPDTTAPDAPTSLNATASNSNVSLTWSANAESDLAGYNIYRSVNGGSTIKLNGSLVVSTSYIDNTVSAGNQYAYTVTAMDLSDNESNSSSAATVSIAPDDSTGGQGSSGGGALFFLMPLMLLLRRKK